MLFDSLAGGTGGRTGSMTPMYTNDDSTFRKKTFGSFTLLPSKHFNGHMLSPYNSVLNFDAGDRSRFVDWRVMYDNDALRRICIEQLQIESPNLHSLNKVMAQSVYAVMDQFSGSPTATCMSQISQNLCFWPPLKYLTPSFYPFVPEDKQHQDKQTAGKLLISALDCQKGYMRSAKAPGKHLGCTLFYRGDVQPS